MRKTIMFLLAVTLLLPFSLDAGVRGSSSSKTTSSRSSSSSKSPKSTSTKTAKAPKAPKNAKAPKTSTAAKPKDSKQPKKSTVAARNKNGKIARSPAARSSFMKESGYPKGRKGYVVDHIVPLECGGADTPSNMQWQTSQEAKIKDRTEFNCRR